LSGTVDIYP